MSSLHISEQPHPIEFGW